LGSLRQVTDGTGAVIDTIAYDAWGNVTSETNSANGGRYKWTGREADNETGLQYNRARYYDPKTGRWTSQDPLGLEEGASNLYRYAKNTPQNQTDPSGRQPRPGDSETNLGTTNIKFNIKDNRIGLIQEKMLPTGFIDIAPKVTKDGKAVVGANVVV